MCYLRPLKALILIFPFFTLSLLAQISFEKTFGGDTSDFGYSVQQTSDRGYIIAGSSASFGNGHLDMYIIKTDSLGNVLWTKIMGGPGEDEAASIDKTKDGGYVICGYSDSLSGLYLDDVYLAKLDSMGNILWTKFYGGSEPDWGRCVRQTSDGGYIIAGWTSSFGTGFPDADIYLVKTDSRGDTLWTRYFSKGTGWEEGRSVQQTSDGGYVVVGCSDCMFSTTADLYIVKVDKEGDTIWTKTLGRYGYAEVANSVQETRDGGYIICGAIELEDNNSDIWLIKMDSLGDTLWTRTIGGTGWDVGYCLEETKEGGYVITGFTWSSGGGMRDVYLVRTDSLGIPIWQRTYGGPLSDGAMCVHKTMDRGYIIVGETNSFGKGLEDVYLIKTDSSGMQVRENTFGQMDPHLSLELFPNISHLGTFIRYRIPGQRFISIKIYDLSGCLIKNLVEQTKNKGSYTLFWNGKDISGKPIPSGFYFIQLKSGTSIITKKFLLLR